MLRIFILCLISGFLLANCEDVLMSSTASIHCYVADPNSQSVYQYVRFQKFDQSSSTWDNLADYKIDSKEKLMTTDNPYYQNNKINFDDNGNVEIKNIQIQDEGQYQCLRAGFGVEEQTIAFDINVFVAPTVSVTKTQDPLNAGSGEVVAAKCVAENGRPNQAVVTWSSDISLSYSQTNSTQEISDLYTVTSELKLEPNKYYNNRPFSCSVTHPAYALPSTQQPSPMEITLNVTYPPEVPVIAVSQVDDKDILNCDAGGNPPPQVWWIMPPVSETPIIYASSVAIISPNDPSRANDTYTCMASNGITPDSSANMSTHEVIVAVTMVKQSNTGIIVGAVFGGLLILAIIIGLIYWFVIRKYDDGEGPYSKGKVYNKQNMQRYGDHGATPSRPTIQHANETINQNRPPSPSHPPPEDRDSTSESDEDDEGDDVELAPRPSSRGITSKASINFQKERKRPSTSPRARARPSYDSPPGNTDPRYEVPPGEPEDEIDDRQHLTHDRNEYTEDPDAHLYDLPQDRYPEYYKDQQYTDQNYEPEYDEDKPITYASLDDRYLGDPNSHRRPSEEHVEYAQIRPAYVV